jgi:hypothetical protein
MLKARPGCRNKRKASLVASGALVAVLGASCGGGGPSAAGDDGAELLSCDDVAAQALGDDLSDDPGVAAQQIVRAQMGFPHDRTYVESHGLFGEFIELTAAEDERMHAGSPDDAAVGDLINAVVAPYASTFPDTFGHVSVGHSPTGPEIVVSFTSDLDLHDTALRDLLDGRAPVRVLPTAATRREANAVGDRIAAHMAATNPRESLITGLGRAGHIAGGEVRVQVMVADHSDSAFDEVMALLERGDEHLVCLKKLGRPVGG